MSSYPSLSSDAWLLRHPRRWQSSLKGPAGLRVFAVFILGLIVGRQLPKLRIRPLPLASPRGSEAWHPYGASGCRGRAAADVGMGRLQSDHREEPGVAPRTSMDDAPPAQEKHINLCLSHRIDQSRVSSSAHRSYLGLFTRDRPQRPFAVEENDVSRGGAAAVPLSPIAVRTWALCIAATCSSPNPQPTARAVAAWPVILW